MNNRYTDQEWLDDIRWRIETADIFTDTGRIVRSHWGEIERLIKRYGLQQRIEERTTLLRGSTPGSLTAASHQYRIDELKKQKAAL